MFAHWKYSVFTPELHRDTHREYQLSALKLSNNGKVTMPLRGILFLFLR